MIDDAVHAWFQAHHVAWVTPLMLAVTWWHATTGLLAMAAALGLLLWRRRERDWLLALAFAVPGAMLLNVALKHLVRRARPVVEQPLLVLDSYSFPSGHAAGTAALYTFLAAWLLSHLQRRAAWQRAILVAAAAAMVLWVSLSRVYLGVHYLSDVTAGMAIGTAWSLAWVALARRRFRPSPET